MSNEEKKKRAEYKKFRQKWITIQGVIIVVLAIIALVSSIMYYRNNRIAYINYSESSDVDYKVYLKENDFYDEEYLEENQIYVSSLIDNIVANFKYDLNVNVKSTDFKYDYKLDAILEISDKNTNMHMYQDITEIKSENGKILSGTDKIVVNEEVKIDFQNFNKKAQAFLNTYDFEKTNYVISKLIVNLRVSVKNVAGQSLDKDEFLVSLNIPLTEQIVNIQMTSTVPSKNGSIEVDNSKSICAFKVISIVSSSLVILALIILLAFVYLTRNQDINYAIKVKKIVNNYKSYIQKINNKFVYTGYQVLMVDTFKEMLEIRDTIDAPILMNENEDQTCTRFIIPTNTKLLYMFEIKVKGFCYDPDEELLGVVEKNNEEIAECESKESEVQEELVPEEKTTEVVIEENAVVTSEKPIKEQKPKKVINPSIEVLAEYIKSNFEDAMIVYGKENKSYRVYRKKKLFLIVQSTNNDYRITFQRKPISMSQLLIKYPKFISKSNSPQGEQWFKVINKGDIYEEELKAIIKFSYKYLIDEEKKAIAKKEKEREKALAKKAAIKAKEKAKRDAQKAKEKAKAAALKAKSKKAVEEKAKQEEKVTEVKKDNIA